MERRNLAPAPAAARTVVARDGLAGATARAVADATPLRDIDEIAAAAVAAHLDAMLTTLRAAAARHSDPDERLRAVGVARLQTFTERPHAAFLSIAC